MNGRPVVTAGEKYGRLSPSPLGIVDRVSALPEVLEHHPVKVVYLKGGRAALALRGILVPEQALVGPEQVVGVLRKAPDPFRASAGEAGPRSTCYPGVREKGENGHNF